MQTCKKPNRSSFLSMPHANDDRTDPQTRPTDPTLECHQDLLLVWSVDESDKRPGRFLSCPGKHGCSEFAQAIRISNATSKLKRWNINIVKYRWVKFLSIYTLLDCSFLTGSFLYCKGATETSTKPGKMCPGFGCDISSGWSVPPQSGPGKRTWHAAFFGILPEQQLANDINLHSHLFLHFNHKVLYELCATGKNRDVQFKKFYKYPFSQQKRMKGQLFPGLQLMVLRREVIGLRWNPIDLLERKGNLQHWNVH